ncbi:MAG: uracil-DNA glycosylase [Slackia sp.]|nr:uracil-DNA glycosylase [Slackia sp.]
MSVVNEHFSTIVPQEGESSELLLADIAAQVEACRKCALCEGRINVVPGFGNPEARVMLIGEAPGKNEDKQGLPFVGAAGKYLTELLGYAGLAREDVFIANVLKCRPPSNRNPQPDEIELCTPFLRDQVRAIGPEYLVTMGNFATKLILKTDRGITGLHGRPQMAGRFIVYPVFHPAAAIYDRSKRDALEADFTALGERLKQPREIG